MLGAYRGAEGLRTVEHECLDKLQELVDDLRDDKELEESQITDLWNELDRVESSAGAGEAEAPAPVEEHDEGALSTKFERYDDADTDVVNGAKADGMNAYTIAIRLDKDTMLKGPRVFLITEHLEKDGEIIRTEPSADLLEEGDFDTDFRMIYLTKDSVYEVKSIIESNTEIDSYIVEEFKEPAAEEEKAEEKTETEEKKTEEKPAEEKKPAAKKPAAKTQAPAHKAKNQAIRVDLTRLDRFLNLVSEIVVYRNQLEDATDRESIGEIRDSLEQVSRLTSELQDLVLKIRMQQVSVVFSRFPRMVRDLSNQLNKEMKLEIIGEETELDKTVVSELSEPLIHLLRNSADHGIEDPETRKKLGKPEVGTITLAAYQEGNKVLITLSDDGKGLKPEVIKASAEKKGIDTTGMTDRELQMLVFHPGFSTAKKITNISGRGVGLDAVQAKITELGGSIEMDSKVDVGTTFIIKLPLTLSIIQALMVQIGKESFAIPLDVVERVVMVREKDIMQTSNQEVCKFQEGLIPIIRTDKLLQVPSSSSDKKYAIIVKIGKQYYGVLVDKMVGQQEIVIKKIDPMLQKIKKYQGATILGNGSIALILDVNAICNSRQ